MPTPVTIPKATITMEEAVVMGWRKQTGERVDKDEILFELETDKVVVEVPSPASGMLLRIDVAAGAAKVNEAVGWIGEAGEVIPEPRHEYAAEALQSSSVGRLAVPETDQLSASPAARRRARELGIDLRQVRGTGPGGRVVESDIEIAGKIDE